MFHQISYWTPPKSHRQPQSLQRYAINPQQIRSNPKLYILSSKCDIYEYVRIVRAHTNIYLNNIKSTQASHTHRECAFGNFAHHRRTVAESLRLNLKRGAALAKPHQYVVYLARGECLLKRMLCAVMSWCDIGFSARLNRNAPLCWGKRIVSTFLCVWCDDIVVQARGGLWVATVAVSWAHMRRCAIRPKGSVFRESPFIRKSWRSWAIPLSANHNLSDFVVRFVCLYTPHTIYDYMHIPLGLCLSFATTYI